MRHGRLTPKLKCFQKLLKLFVADVLSQVCPPKVPLPIPWTHTSDHSKQHLNLNLQGS